MGYRIGTFTPERKYTLFLPHPLNGGRYKMSAQSISSCIPVTGQSLRNAPFAAWAKTIDGRHVEANPAAERLAGRPVLGLTAEELFGHEHAAEVREAEAAARALGIDQRLQLVGDTVVLVIRWPEDGLIRGIAIRMVFGPTV